MIKTYIKNKKQTNLGLPWWLSGKEFTNAGDTGSIPGSGRSHMRWDN